MKKTVSSAACCALWAFASVALAAPAQPGVAPNWLSLGPGTPARVDAAPWYAFDEPEAALVTQPASLRRDFLDDRSRPGDVLYAPIGARVRVVALLPGARIARVRVVGDGRSAYAPVNRLVPEIPPGTALVVAGTFEGYANFYPTLVTPAANAVAIATGTRLTAETTAVAPAGADGEDVRVRVRVENGPLRGRTGYVAVTFTGIPEPAARLRTQTERACSCRPVSFDDV